MLKDFQVDLELSPKDNRVIQTGATYWSHDVNTAKIVVNLKRNSEPIILSSTVSVRMIMVFDDNDTQKKQVHKMTIDDTQNGVVSLILPKETLGFVGNVLCGVYVNYGENQSTDNGYFTFSMRRSLIDGEFPQLENGYVSEFQTMLDYMIETASEFDNVEEELNKRIDVIEKDIESNEIVKKNELNIFIEHSNRRFKDSSFKITGTDFLSPPMLGYNAGETWYFDKDTKFPGMNILRTNAKRDVAANTSNEHFKEIKLPTTAIDPGEYYISTNVYISESNAEILYLSFGYANEAGNFNEDITSMAVYHPVTKGQHKIFKKVTVTKPKLETSTNKLLIRFSRSTKLHTTTITYKDLSIIEVNSQEIYDWSPAPLDILKENNILISNKDNSILNFNDWSSYSGEKRKPNILDLQKQIDELKNAITTLGGTL